MKNLHKSLTSKSLKKLKINGIKNLDMTRFTFLDMFIEKQIYY